MLAELHEPFDHDDTVHITTGKESFELSVVKADKGHRDGEAALRPQCDCRPVHR